MINWNEVEEDIIPLIWGERQTRNLLHYFQNLIEKEFKLVASGEVKLRGRKIFSQNLNGDCNELEEVYLKGEKDIGLNEILTEEEAMELEHKNISIYISENKD